MGTMDDSATRQGNPDEREDYPAMHSLVRIRRCMQKNIVASVLGVGLGIFFSGQAFAADTTPPVITPTVTGTLGNNGWYTSNVTVNWDVSDPESPIKRRRGCASVTRYADAASKTFTCTAISNGGTARKSVTIKKDSTPPKAAIVTPASGAIYATDKTILASYSCADLTSKVNNCTGTVAKGANIDTTTAGLKTFSVIIADKAGNTTTISKNYIVRTPPVAVVKGTHLFAWNDLGMHCADSDYSVFTLLPPFNNLISQLVVNGKLINTASSANYALTYESTPDPKGSINSSSYNKTNFWDYDQPLFGVDLTPDVGLTGNPTSSYTPAPLTWSGPFNWYEATGIPIMPIDDKLAFKPYPMVRVIASDNNGKPIASSNTVLPVSSEINCFICHASDTGSEAAKPAAGWVNLTNGSEQDWRLNILRLHDEKNAGPNYANLLTQKGYGDSLESSAYNNGKPVLCDTCHNSNALAIWGINGEAGVSNMTAAMHSRHAQVTLPGTTQTLDSIGTRSSCYYCHPGQKTQCLRGAMGNPLDSKGKHKMDCQSCHGSMETVGNISRNGWFDMPTCQSCHYDGKRDTNAINADGTFKSPTDKRFASNPDTPMPGTSLFRFSTGHGKLQCEACHNSTHAEFTSVPSASGNQVNDNQQAIKAQGFAAPIRNCTVCHPTMPNTINGGPHGMHSIGQTWVSGHEDALEGTSKSACYYCHGATRSGSPLAVMKARKSFSIDDDGTKVFAVNERVTCWSCHNGPNP